MTAVEDLERLIADAEARAKEPHNQDPMGKTWYRSRLLALHQAVDLIKLERDR